MREPVGHGLRWALSVLGIFVVTTVLLLIALTIFAPTRHSVVLDLTSRAVQLRFIGTNDWTLPRLIVCKRLDKPRFGRAAGGNNCNPAVFDETTRAAGDIRWPNNSTVLVRMWTPDQVQIVLRSSTADLPAGSVLILNTQDWRQSGALAFIGTVVAGSPMQNGQKDVVEKGNYMVREQSSVVEEWFGRSGTHVIKTGTFSRGDAIRVIRAESVGATEVDAQMFGSLLPRGDSTKSGFHLDAVSVPGDLALQVIYFGGASPVIIKPGWIERAQSDPALLAVAIVLALLGNVSQVLGFPSPIRRRPPAPEAPHSEPPPPPRVPRALALSGLRRHMRGKRRRALRKK